jgi:hypothetical protein
MDSKDLEPAVALGRRVQHLFLAMVDGQGVPYVNSARQIEQLAGNQFAVEEWICPLTVTNLGLNPKTAVLVWDPATDGGYEILGEVLMFEDQAFLNGFAPEVEKGENDYLPQVKRRLIIRAERITAFRRALRCAATAAHPAEGRSQSPAGDNNGTEVSVCKFAPEWAEHARFEREDAPCDDGRAGTVHAG